MLKKYPSIIWIKLTTCNNSAHHTDITCIGIHPKKGIFYFKCQYSAVICIKDTQVIVQF